MIQIYTNLLCCSLPVPLSLAETCTIPLASMSNVTSIWGTPLGAGGMPMSENWPSILLSFAISRSPWWTYTTTDKSRANISLQLLLQRKWIGKKISWNEKVEKIENIVMEHTSNIKATENITSEKWVSEMHSINECKYEQHVEMWEITVANMERGRWGQIKTSLRWI